MLHHPINLFFKRSLHYGVVFFLFLFFSTACSPALPDDIETAMQDLPEKLDFNLDVKPVLSDRCFACHGPDKAKQKAGLRLDLAEAAFEELPENPGKHAIRPGNLGDSEVFHRLVTTDPELVMPPAESDLHLSPYEKAVLIRWIEEGAEYKPHWAFLKPERPDLPKVQNQELVVNPIDPFILQKVEQKGWEPAPEADKETLLRRLSFDLTGLPPSLEEMNAFLEDKSPKAYENAVDRFLASSHYGEQMATDWMDVARFADTHGYTVDRYRDMSVYRDWVIKAFNENMPYDQFTIWQLAGDLLPNPTREQLLATAFNRNHQQNMEGGIVQEEFRVEYVADRTNTLGAAFLGLTLECARCHDHKYDPISQENYYQFFSFFNNVKEAGQISWDNAMPVPTMLLTTEKTDSIVQFIDKEIDKKTQEIAALDEQLSSSFEDWVSSKRLKLPTSKVYPEGLVAHYTFDGPNITNRLAPQQKGVMKQAGVQTKITPNIQEGKNGKGLLLDGDAWLDLGSVAVFDRADPFSVGIWTKVPEGLKEGVLFHKGDGAAIYNFRGYHLALKDNRLELMLAHTEPYNAIVEYAENIPRNEWIQLTMTYDGSNSAKGLKIYLNGKELETEVENDNLYKSILFGRDQEPGLQIGARWRGIGVKGATVDDIVAFNRALTGLEVMQLSDQKTFHQLVKKPVADLNTKEKNLLKEFYTAHALPVRRQELRQLQVLRQQQHETVDTVQEAMVMQEMEKPRPTYILDRGQYDAYGEPVTSNTPESLLPMPEDLPKNRLGLAKWLVQAEHPLTSRIMVNRLWQHFFGRGLVRTAEDFGNQGELPSHPALLDWLAVEFVESGWDIKGMVKQIVLSATYRQSSKTPEQLSIEDPQNIFLARGPSLRLTAEMLRDNALAVSGLLVKKIGGPSVKPYQPDGLWRINGSSYQRDQGEKLYRRSLYTFWKRTIPNPTQATFDAPSRDICNVRRQKTSTPLQALVLLNDPVYVEAAKAIGQKISETGDLSKGIRTAFRQLTGRQPTSNELQLLKELQQSEQGNFAKNPDKLNGWLNTGDFKINGDISPVVLAANTVVASTIINADATIVKR